MAEYSVQNDYTFGNFYSIDLKCIFVLSSKISAIIRADIGSESET